MMPGSHKGEVSADITATRKLTPLFPTHSNKIRKYKQWFLQKAPSGKSLQREEQSLLKNNK